VASRAERNCWRGGSRHRGIISCHGHRLCHHMRDGHAPPFERPYEGWSNVLSRVPLVALARETALLLLTQYSARRAATGLVVINPSCTIKSRKRLTIRARCSTVDTGECRARSRSQASSVSRLTSEDES